jgi:magnesium-transporting ATPase (P-type)
MHTKLILVDSASEDLLNATKNFGITTEKLMQLVDPKNPALLETLGGVEGVASKLGVSTSTGLSSSNPADISARKAAFGENRLPKKREKNIFEFIWEAIQDKTLIILSVVAVISIAVGIYETIVKNDGYPYYVEGGQF